MNMNFTDRIGLSISKTMVEKVDNDRGDIPRSRFIGRILQNYYQIQEPIEERSKKNSGLSHLNTAAKQTDSDKPIEI